MMDDAIVMDKETFRLLASDTRISILKLLRHRDYNLSEISRKLNLSKSTVKEHLNQLVKADVIKEIDRGKWKYFSLTRYGIKLVGQKEERTVKRVVIILGIILIGFFVIFMFPGMSGMFTMEPSSSETFDAQNIEQGTGDMERTSETSEPAEPSISPGLGPIMGWDEKDAVATGSGNLSENITSNANNTTTTPDDASNTTITPDDASNTTITPDDANNTTTTPDEANNTTTTPDDDANNTTTTPDDDANNTTTTS